MPIIALTPMLYKKIKRILIKEHRKNLRALQRLAAIPTGCDGPVGIR